MTTENVTILFTDVVGSTELAFSLSPEGADEARRAHFSILRQALAEANGREVKNLGDGLMAVFGSASAALSCAVTMQQRSERDGRDREFTVGLRVGLSGGEVTREEDDYFGDPVIEAARLCAICESGQILAADVVRAMAGRRSRQQSHPLGPLTLKGLPDPVETVEILWEPLGVVEVEAVIPLPARLALGPPVGLVGREHELEVLAATIKRVGASGGREIVLVSGEAGLGKTTIVAEASRAAFGEGACVLFGHSEEDLATPYGLFAEALGHYCLYAPDTLLVAHVAEYGSELARLVPTLARRIADLPPSKATDTDTERYLLFSAVVGMLRMASEHQPVVLVLDDLQWADRASMLLLRHLASTDQPLRVLVVGTYRDSELPRSHPLLETLAALHRLGGVRRLELSGFDDAGVVAMMEAVAGRALDDSTAGLALAVHHETDGNPFFVSEVLRHLSEIGVMSQYLTGRLAAGRIQDHLTLPNTVREVIGARVARLGRDAEHVLTMAAVIGRDFDLELVSRATNISADELLDILEAAAEAALVREMTDAQGRYYFAHALIQRTLYEDLGPNRRARAHRLVAEALEEMYGDRPSERVGELARHWFRATKPIDLAKALGYSRQAADAALASLAPADARDFYSQALDLYSRTEAPDPVLGLDLAIGLGTAERQTGDPGFRDTLLDVGRRAAAIGDTDRLVAAALANDRGFATAAGVVDADKVEILELALDRLPAKGSERALVLATLCSELTWGSPLERRRALAEEAIAVADASDDDAIVVRVLNNVSYPLIFPSLLVESLDRSAAALVRAERLGDPVLLFFARAWRLVAIFRAGDSDEAERCLALMASDVDRLDQPSLSWVDALARVVHAQIAGDIEAAEELAGRALRLGTDGSQPDAMVYFGAHLSMSSWMRGTIGDYVTTLERAVADNPGLPGLAGLLAIADLGASRPDDARRVLDELVANGTNLPQDPAWLTGMVEYAEAAIECRHPAVEPLFDLLAPWRDQQSTTGGSTAHGPISHYLGGLATVLGRFDEADAYFAQANAFNQRAGAKFFAARTNLSWGKMLVERGAPGDTETARDLLAKALTAATTHGYADVERNAAHALADLD